MRNEWQEIFRRAASNGIREQRERERELGSRETLRVAIGRFHKKKHRCRAAICATCLAGGRRKESGNGITILSSGWKEGRKKEGGEGGRAGGIRRSHVSRRRPFFISRTPPCILFLGAPGVRDAPLSSGDAVPDICCSLSSSPQQGICIIIISPRPSRKLELRTGATIRSFGPVVVVVVVVKKREEKKSGSGKRNSETCFR